MNYYYINTEANAFNGRSPHNKWIEYCHAFTSGEYEKYGVQVFGILERGDICFMYVNGGGIVAVGRVCEHWDRCSYEGENRWIYKECDKEYIEYRIPIDWHLKFVNNPICIKELRHILGLGPHGWSWRSTLGSITKDKASQLLKLARERNH